MEEPRGLPRSSTPIRLRALVMPFEFKGSPLNSNGITKVLNRVGLAERGKPFGSSILRHSYLSHKYAEVSQEKEKDADMMGHSVATQGDYVKTD